MHEDSTGHRGLVTPGLAQRMSAGSGIVHAERNDAFRIDPTAPVVPVRFVQMWLRPDTPGTPPAYAAGAVDLADLAPGGGRWPRVDHPDAAVGLATRGRTLWVTRLAPGVVRLTAGRGADPRLRRDRRGRGRGGRAGWPRATRCGCPATPSSG